jgi:hypothetical protein
MNTSKRLELLLSIWWLLLPVGIGLVILGVLTGASPLRQGGPILIGLGCLFCGTVGAF